MEGKGNQEPQESRLSRLAWAMLDHLSTSAFAITGTHPEVCTPENKAAELEHQEARTAQIIAETQRIRDDRGVAMLRGYNNDNDRALYYKITGRQQ